MKITELNSVTPVLPLQEGAEKSARVAPSTTESSDRVSLSTEAQQMQAAQAARIAALQKAIADGKYAIDFDRLAEAIISREVL